MLMLALVMVRGSDASSGLEMLVWTNTALGGEPQSNVTVLNHAGDNLSLLWSPSKPFSSEVLGQLHYPQDGNYAFSCSFQGLSLAFVWLNDHQICNFGAYNNSESSTDGTVVYPIRGIRSKPDTLRIHAYTSDESLNHQTENASLHVQWAKVNLGTKVAAPAFAPIPAAALTPGLPPLEQSRRSFQRDLVQGWAPWIPKNYMPMVLLPHSARITPAICQLSTGTCLTGSTGADDRNSNVRAGLYAPDRYEPYWYNTEHHARRKISHICDCLV